MQKKVSFFLRLLLLIVPLFNVLGAAETQPPPLSPKSLQPQPKPALVKPKSNPGQKRKKEPVPSTFESISFSILIGTPLIYENFYNKRFAALGNFYLFSIPVFRLDEELFLHFETGPGFTYAKLTFENPPQTYSHIYLVAPARFRLIYSLNPSFHLEVFAGLMLRPIEYNSRQTTDGGTQSVKGPNFITADAGLGFDYNFNPSIKMRVLAGYLFLAGGIELCF